MLRQLLAEVTGQCVNAVAAHFDVVPELVVLPPELFTAVLHTALGTGCPKALLQVRVCARVRVC